MGILSPFTTNEIDLKKNDRIYIFTDGYADQFGGIFEVLHNGVDEHPVSSAGADAYVFLFGTHTLRGVRVL